MLPAQRASGRSYFLERLLTELVFVEEGLAGTHRGWERKRQLAVAAGYALLGAVGLGLTALWWTSWRNNARYVDAVDARVEAGARLVQQTPNRASSDLLPLLPALQATRSLALTGTPDESAPMSMGFGLFQGRRLDSAARFAYQQMLHDAVLPRLALRFEEQLRVDAPPESQYEVLKSYLMMYDLPHFDPVALKAQIVADWDQRYTRSVEPDQLKAMDDHLDALLGEGAAVSPLPKDQALVDATRNRIAAVALPQRVYNRLRLRGLGSDFPDFDAVKAGGGNVPLVFQRASGLPLTKGVPGLYSYRGYHEGLQSVVEEATKQLEDEQGWVLGVTSDAGGGVRGAIADKLPNDVRTLYLNDYRDAWKAYIADLRVIPPTSTDQAIERTRFLSAPDSPLLPLMKAISRETTLLGGQGLGDRANSTAQSAVEAVRNKVLGQLGGRPTQAAPGERIESIVDNEFTDLRRMVTAPEGGKAPLESVVAQLADLQVLLIAVKQAVASKSPPPVSPLPNMLIADAAKDPEPLRSLLNTLGRSSLQVANFELRAQLAGDVRAKVGDFCGQAINGRYPFDPSASREVTPSDFAALFGPGGRFDQMQQQLAQYIDTGTRPWSFRMNNGSRLGEDAGTLPQFQRAAAIRDAFFAGGNGPSIHLVMKPVEMDAQLREFILDVDGQIVRYDHGPQIPQPVNWPGPRGTGVVRVTVQPAGGTGMVTDGPWALSRMFDKVGLQPGSAPEKFRAVFDIDGRKATFDVTASSVRNPLGMQELRAFSCPNGL
jgi:type VI secretion system protein ImpL